ncbi:MAG: fatty acid desaturase family protein [Kiloniellaceae bacterium]
MIAGSIGIYILWLYMGAGLSAYFYIPATIFFSGMLYRYLSEWLHEGIHYNIHPDRNINEFVSGWLLAPLMGTPLKQIRKAHFVHHGATQYFGDDDPDTRYLRIRSRSGFFKGVISDISGLSALSVYWAVVLRKVFTPRPRQNEDGSANSIGAFLIDYVPVASINALLLAVAVLTVSLPQLLMTYAGLLCVYPVLSRLRAYGQHLPLSADGHWMAEASTGARSVEGTLWDRLFIASRLMLYHHEHHLYPALPYRALIAIKEAVEGDPNRYTRSHWPVLWALMMPEAKSAR